MGPAIQALGIVYEIAHILAVHAHSTLSPRHMLFEPGFLLVIVGFLVSMVCVPVAVAVAQASPEDVAIPVYEPVEAERPEMLEGAE
ncbi:MAG TPA: hypothetical protein VI759_05675 [Dehalococcoidia bacterium]|nr:hypothetical protein [Dehalococcoidia bacterium]